MRKGLCEISNPKQWKTISTEMLTPNGYPVYGANGIIGYFSDYNHTEETLLITCRGATCGSLNICEPYSYVNGNAMAIDNLSEEVDLKYLYYYLLNRGLDDVITGSAQPQIVRQSLTKVYVEYPELNEQKEIVFSLNKVEQLIFLRKQQLSKLDEFVKSRFIELFGDPAINEKGWIIRNLENVTTVVTYGLTVRPEYIAEGIDLVSAKELHKGFIDYNAAPKISENDFEKLSEKAKPQKNDILFSKTGSIGHCALVTDDKPFAITQNAARIGLKSETVNPLWLLYYLRMDYIQDWCKEHAKGNAVKDFQLQDMKVIPLFDCPLELQNQFTAFIEQTDKSKFEIQKSLNQLETLKKALMQKYFG